MISIHRQLGLALALCLPFVASAQGPQGGQGRRDGGPNGNVSQMTCASENGRRVYCNTDTRGGVQLIRKLSRNACRQGTSWGYDRRGIWVDRGCRAEFAVSAYGFTGREVRVSAGTNITVRTNETIDARFNDGRVFTAQVMQDVLDQTGSIAIPRNSPAEVIFRSLPDQELVLDLESVSVNGQRFALAADLLQVSGNDSQRDGIGANQRTGKYVGGGAILGSIIGAIAGGGKGAAIGAAAGAGAGAGGQLLTRGRRVRIPAESVITFRLDQSLLLGVTDNGYNRGKQHYHYPEYVGPDNQR
ncbi:MAG: DUF3011 domain-containing protein [Acidobacteriota bacterium]